MKARKLVRALSRNGNKAVRVHDGQIEFAAAGLLDEVVGPAAGRDLEHRLAAVQVEDGAERDGVADDGDTAFRVIVPDRDAPIMFAKSPRSCIIDPGEPFYIVDGRSRTDYEGEIKNSGDKVYIRTLGDVTINNYSKGQKLTYERIESPDIEMLIELSGKMNIPKIDIDKGDIKVIKKTN